MLSNNTGPLYNDIFKLRAKLISDFNMKSRIHLINERKSPYKKEKFKINRTRFETEVDKLRGLKDLELNEKFETLQVSTIDPLQNKLPKIKTTISELESEKGFAKNKNLTNVLIEGRKLINKMKKDKIESENAKFAKRLVRVRSPLRRDLMNKSFKRSREYAKIANRVKSKEEVAVGMVRKLHLPDIVLRGLGDIKKLIN